MRGGNGTVDATPQSAPAVAAGRPFTWTPNFGRASVHSRRR
ncbi:MAG TPA: hypothetical protein VFJ07_22035 [Streptosporangiaceae bacterium]|nr:hypothetical protein [Streptosporangiaceae bacterium]